MKKSTDVKINMYRTVKKTYEDNRAGFDVIAVFAVIFLKFTDMLASIERLMPIALFDARAWARIAMERKVELAEKAAKVAACAGAYASAEGLTALWLVMDWSAAALKVEKKDRLPVICKEIHDQATLVQVAAERYGVTRADLEALAAAIPLYIAASNAPRVSYAKKWAANRDIEALLVEADGVLNDQLDRLVQSQSASNPTLVQLWRTARKLVNSRTKTTQLLIRVKNGELLPVPDAMTVVLNGQRYTETTNTEGEALYKPAPFGLVDVQVSAPGYAPYVLKNMKLVRGRETVLEVGLR